MSESPPGIQDLPEDFTEENHVRRGRPFRILNHSMPGILAIPIEQMGFISPLLTATIVTVLAIIYFIVFEGFRKAVQEDHDYWTVRMPRATATMDRLIAWAIRNGEIRPGEVTGIIASSWYTIGLLITYFVFPPYVAVPAIMFLAFGDPMARSFGIRFKKHLGDGSKILPDNKTFAGCIGFMVASLIAGSISLYFHFHGYPLYPPGMSAMEIETILFFGAFVAMVAELFSGDYDNLAIPLTSGYLMWWLFG